MLQLVLDILHYIWIGIVFVTIISLLVAAHELGHYLFARLFKMGVEEFAIGFGRKPIWTFGKRAYTIPIQTDENPGFSGPLRAGLHQRDSGERSWESNAASSGSLEGAHNTGTVEVVEAGNGFALKETTVFTFRPWPLGGFVRIKGMVPEEDGSETKVAGGFYSKPPWQRLIVLFAGPLFSVLAGILILIPLFMSTGVVKPDNSPVLGTLVPDAPAARAGLREGDRILSIDGKPTERFFDVLAIVRASPGQLLSFELERDGVRQTIPVTPAANPVPTFVLNENLEPTGDTKPQGKIGVAWRQQRVPVGFVEATREAWMAPVRVVVGVAGLFARPERFESSVGGPVSMVKITNAMVLSGIESLLHFAALLSISVGILNLLPIPPLDGGQMLVAFAELLRGGKRLSLKLQAMATTAGMAFVFMLMISALFVDVKRLVEGPGNERRMKQALTTQPQATEPEPAKAP